MLKGLEWVARGACLFVINGVEYTLQELNILRLVNLIPKLHL